MDQAYQWFQVIHVPLLALLDPQNQMDQDGPVVHPILQIQGHLKGLANPALLSLLLDQTFHLFPVNLAIQLVLVFPVAPEVPGSLRSLAYQLHLQSLAVQRAQAVLESQQVLFLLGDPVVHVGPSHQVGLINQVALFALVDPEVP